MLGDTLASLGLGTAGWLENEADAAVAVLAQLTPDDIEAVPLAAVAASILDSRLEPYDPRLDHFEHLLTSGGQPGELGALLDALHPVSVDRDAPFMSGESVAAHDQLWSQLPHDMFPDGSFASMSLVEQVTEGIQYRLRISVQRSTAANPTIFVRLIDPAAGPPQVLAVDAMLADGTGFSTVMDEPPGFDFDRTRIEIVDNLNHPLLSAADHAKVRGRQWALLALAAERRQQWPEATRCWRLSEQMHRAGGDPGAAREAAEYARGVSERAVPPFLVESGEAADIAEPEPEDGDE